MSADFVVRYRQYPYIYIYKSLCISGISEFHTIRCGNLKFGVL